MSDLTVTVPPDLLAVTTEVVGRTTVVRAAGEVDMATAPALQQALFDACLPARRPAALVVDLTAVRFFGSTGLGLLVVTHRRCLDRGVPLRIVAGAHAVLRPLEVTGLDLLFDVVPTLDAALSRAAPRLASPVPTA
ncbi:MAG TPA: STAS domain-containing protein [Pseudonocardiaceae bacterium]